MGAMERPLVEAQSAIESEWELMDSTDLRDVRREVEGVKVVGIGEGEGRGNVGGICYVEVTKID